MTSGANCAMNQVKNQSSGKMARTNWVWFLFALLLGAGWEHLPPTNVAWVRFLDAASYVGWGCFWFSILFREVFLQVLRFSPLLKNQIPFRSWSAQTFLNEFLQTPWCSVGKTKYNYNSGRFKNWHETFNPIIKSSNRACPKRKLTRGSS